MSDYPIPANESERLDGLRQLQILDTAAESRYDRLTKAARETVGARFCMLSFIDKERQWFKSTQGALVSETPRAFAFCAHTILSKQHCIVPDATLDERFRNNPVVRAPGGIRFYAGIPIHDDQGQPVGSFCVADTQPRELSNEDLQSLSRLASEVESELRRPANLPQGKELLEDGLGCYNRAGLEKALTSGTRYPSSIVVQLTGQKQVTETFGSEAAALLLKETLDCLRLALRPQDQLGRISPERFLVLSTCPPTHLQAYTNDLRHQLEEMPTLHRDLRLKPQLAFTDQGEDRFSWSLQAPVHGML
ncbi:GAF domain-containing protein [bacterium]|nr:GAF domain-containing protein [bacterium]